MEKNRLFSICCGTTEQPCGGQTKNCSRMPHPTHDEFQIGQRISAKIRLYEYLKKTLKDV